MLRESGHDYEALAAKLNTMGIEISARELENKNQPRRIFYSVSS